MNGFVLNLLSRSRGTADVVRPRLASLFEPGETRASRLEGQPPLVEDSEETSSIERRAAPPAILTPSQQELTSSPPRSSQASRDWRALVEPGEAQTRVSDRQIQPSPTPGLAREREAALAGAEEHSERRFSALDGVRHQRDRVSPPPAPRSARPAGSAAPAALVDRGPLGRSDTVHASQSNYLAPRAITAAAPPLVPAQPARFRFEPPASHTRAAADQIVEVSIGRIEVRAVVERGADRKASTAPPVMGLEEYLKTRVRGSAR